MMLVTFVAIVALNDFAISQNAMDNLTRNEIMLYRDFVRRIQLLILSLVMLPYGADKDVMQF